METHQEIGRDLKLFLFDDVSPGSCFFLPHGMHIFNNLIELVRKQYRKMGYKEVSTPVMADKRLWMQSGHWNKYKENMFLMNKINEEYEFGLCAMHCPCHCVMFDQMKPSYKDLPLRLADFGPLHRNEASGALRGLTRLRLFHQDDAHIFCTFDQIDNEISDTLNLLSFVYNKFGFKFDVVLSTRPDNFIGNEENWDIAEKILKKHVERFNGTINEKDGAFYGPKIDIHIKDSLNRSHQCGTIQLDFNLPSEERFNLKYADKDGSLKHPVIIHRAVYGSIERFMAILLEHTKGKLPFWLSPRQILIIPHKITKHIEYCINLKNKLSNFEVSIDDSGDTLNKRILNGELMKYNYIIVIGGDEIEKNTVTLRYREGENVIISKLSMEDAIKKFNDMKN